MLNIIVPGRGRLSLEVIVGSQPCRTVADVLLAGDLYEKVRLSDEQRNLLSKALPDGRLVYDDKAIEALPDTEIGLEQAEVRKLKEILESFVKDPGLKPADAGWFRVVFRQLEAQ